MITTIERQAVVPHTPRAMFELVADVEAYPQFLPWCRAARVRHRGEAEMQATLEVARSPLRVSFTTRNVFYDASRIDIHLLDGPFSHLEGTWRFRALSEGGTRVSLHMAFEFSQRLLRATLTPVFEEIAATMVEAFRRRADEVYGAG